MDYSSNGSDWYTTAGGLAVLAIAFVVWLVFVIAGIRIIQKAGYSGWWILIALVPIVGTIMFLVFAYSTWPVQREVEAWRARSTTLPGQYPPGGYPPQ